MNTIDFEQLKLLPLLDRAKELALIAHRGQVDKAGENYINHPIRVAHKCNTDEEKIVALLHDVIEDSDITQNDLFKLGFSTEIVEAVLSVTKKYGEDYQSFITRCKQNPIGRIVKLHDLEDNLDITRVSSITVEDVERLNKYLSARTYLIT